MLPEEEVRQSTKRVRWSDTLPQNPFQLQFHATGKFAPKYFNMFIFVSGLVQFKMGFVVVCSEMSMSTIVKCNVQHQQCIM